MAIGKLDLVASVKWGVSFENVLKDLKCGCIGVRLWLALDLTFGCVWLDLQLGILHLILWLVMCCLICLDLGRLQDLDGWYVFCVGAMRI